MKPLKIKPRKSLVATLLLLIHIVVVKFTFFDFRFVSGLSMFPTYKEHELLLVSRLSSFRNNDIVAAYDPDGCCVVKRIIASGGDTLVFSPNAITLNGKVILSTNVHRAFKPSTIIVPENCVFLLGDNFLHSQDSTDYGPISREKVIGKIVGG